MERSTGVSAGTGALTPASPPHPSAQAVIPNVQGTECAKPQNAKKVEKLLSLETFGAGELKASQGQWVLHSARSGRNQHRAGHTRHGAAVPDMRDFNLFFHFFLLFSFMSFSPSPPSALLHNPCVW